MCESYDVKSVSEAVRWVTEFQGADSNATLWFRGARSRSDDLIPGAYRRPPKKYDEYQPLLDFVQEGLAYGDVGEIDDWKTYYLAEHHGIPTRLLDWTTSFMVALYFAVCNWNRRTTPCIWIMKPDHLNLISTKYKGLITPEQNDELKLWLPRQVKKGHQTLPPYDNSLPVAIYPRKYSHRVLAQQGAFTIHGTERLKLNDWLPAKDNEALYRLDLVGIDKEAAIEDLRILGVHQHTLFPDLDNFVQHLQRKHGWK
jgi:hypothetical protein